MILFVIPSEVKRSEVSATQIVKIVFDFYPLRTRIWQTLLPPLAG